MKLTMYLATIASVFVLVFVQMAYASEYDPFVSCVHEHCKEGDDPSCGEKCIPLIPTNEDETQAGIATKSADFDCFMQSITCLVLGKPAAECTYELLNACRAHRHPIKK